MVKDCLWFGVDETWEHIILYNENYYQRAKLIYNLKKKLLKIDREVELE